jgi:hypothetical protein
MSDNWKRTSDFDCTDAKSRNITHTSKTLHAIQDNNIRLMEIEEEYRNRCQIARIAYENSLRAFELLKQKELADADAKYNEMIIQTIKDT